MSLVLAPRAAGASSPAAPERCGVGGTPSHQEGPQVHLHVLFTEENPQESPGVMFHASQRASMPFSGHEASSQEVTSWPGLGNAHLPSVSVCWGLGWDGPAQGRQSNGKSQQGYPLSTTALISWRWGGLHDRTEQKINKNTQFGQGQPIYCGILGQETDDLVL